MSCLAGLSLAEYIQVSFANHTDGGELLLMEVAPPGLSIAAIPGLDNTNTLTSAIALGIKFAFFVSLVDFSKFLLTSRRVCC